MDRAVEGRDQLRHEALHGRIGNGDETVGNQLRVGEHVAKIVVDLRDGHAELGEAVLLG